MPSPSGRVLAIEHRELLTSGHPAFRAQHHRLGLQRVAARPGPGCFSAFHSTGALPRGVPAGPMVHEVQQGHQGQLVLQLQGPGPHAAERPGARLPDLSALRLRCLERLAEAPSRGPGAPPYTAHHLEMPCSQAFQALGERPGTLSDGEVHAWDSEAIGIRHQEAFQQRAAHHIGPAQG